MRRTVTKAPTAMTGPRANGATAALARAGTEGEAATRDMALSTPRHDSALLQSSNLHFRGNLLPLKARINGGLVYLDTLLPTSTGPVLLIHEGDEPQDKASQSKSKRSEE